MKKLIVLLMAAFQMSAFAGAKGGNGGDPCEDRFQVMRDKVKDWITDGGSKELTLPDGVSLEHYNLVMLDKIAKANISCTSDKILIGKDEKTCKNFVDEDGQLQILCNRADLIATLDTDLPVLVHHEYAGAADLEANEGDPSTYTISNQLRAFYEATVAIGLAITRQTPQPANGVRENFKDFVGQYDVVACHEDLNSESGHAKSCSFQQADIFFGNDYQPNEAYDSLYLTLSKTAADPDNWASIGIAENENSVGDVCSSFYGTQFCDRDFHGLIQNISIKKEGDLIRLDYIHSWPLSRKNYLYRNLSLMLKKSDRPPFDIRHNN